MKKTIILSIIFLLGILTASAQLKVEYSKKCKVYKHFYKFGKPLKTGYEVKNMYFNENNKLLKLEILGKRGKLKQTIIYKYTENELLNKELYFSQDNKLSKIKEYVYIDSTKLSIVKIYNAAGMLIKKTKYNYLNDDKNWNEREKYDHNGIYSKTVVEEFNSERQRVSGKVYGKDNKLELTFKILNHDKFGNETKKILYNLKGEIFSFYTQKYNESNKIIDKYYKGQYKISYEYKESEDLYKEIHYDINTYEPVYLLFYEYKK